MTPSSPSAHHHESQESTFFGFWVYIMTDLIMFATLFAAYAVLRGNSFGGPTERDLFNLPFVLTETLILLTSSFTIGLSLVAAQARQTRAVLLWLSTTFVLGATFLIMEIYEFSALIKEGASYTVSAFLSSYFALVGTHGLHIAAGLLWIAVIGIVVYKKGINDHVLQKLTLLGLFWHFLDIVWIFIFTIVYLMGVM